MLRDVELHRSILGDFGHLLTSDSLILDFGCGDGQTVNAYRQAGFQAFGADLLIEHPGEWLRVIDSGSGYRIPFPDDTFDFVYSNSVLEHVDDLHPVLAEMRRVLKPGGASLHLFPPRWRPIEPHVFVPFGGVLQRRWWLLLWAFVGVRNSFQTRLGYRQTATSNFRYLHQKTFYRTTQELNRLFGGYFSNVTFADQQMIEHSYGRARHLAPIATRLPLIAKWYGALHQRCVFCEK
jgi:SAM-dependent methyltransferase